MRELVAFTVGGESRKALLTCSSIIVQVYWSGCRKETTPSPRSSGERAGARGFEIVNVDLRNYIFDEQSACFPRPLRGGEEEAACPKHVLFVKNIIPIFIISS